MGVSMVSPQRRWNVPLLVEVRRFMSPKWSVLAAEPVLPAAAARQHSRESPQARKRQQDKRFGYAAGWPCPRGDSVVQNGNQGKF